MRILTLTHFLSLVNPEGRREQLFRLRGTIPVSFRGKYTKPIHICTYTCIYIMFLTFFKGANYNIPVLIWLQKTHPQSNPIVYVTPTPDMNINPSRYVDGTGRVYLPYLTEWKQV